MTASAILLLACASTVFADTGALQTVAEWNLIQYDIPFNYPNADKYKPEAAMPTGFEVGWDKIYITTPRIFNGNPATLGWIPRNLDSLSFGTNKSPLLQAYPSWEWHVEAASGEVLTTPKPNCSNLVSVFRVRADKCNRLWVVDSGVMDSLENFKRVCPPKILLFDMKTDRLLRTVTLPNEILRVTTLLVNFVIDDQTDESEQPNSHFGKCDNVFVYLTDDTAFGFLVYDARTDTAWRLSHPYMYPDPNVGPITVADETFSLMNGVIGIAVSPGDVANRRLYFQPFTSKRLFSVPTSVLKAGPNMGIDTDLPVSVDGYKSSPAVPLIFDPNNGALLFSPLSEIALVAWNPGTDKTEVLAQNREKLQGVLDIRTPDRDQGTIWVISSRVQKFVKKSLDKRDVNIRILRLVRHPNYSPYTFNKKDPLLIFK